MQSKVVDFEQAVDGYIVNSGLSKSTQQAVARIQSSLLDNFPDVVWAAPLASLHITLLDLLTPVMDYSRNKDDLFREFGPQWAKALRAVLLNRPPIEVTFDRIEIHPAAIIIKGTDDGSYQQIRQEMVGKVDFLDGTKPAPDIIHATICKFKKEVELDAISSFLSTQSINVRETVREFRLVRETKVFMLESETLEVFPLL